MDKDLYDIKTGWAVYKWGLLIPKKRVLTYCKLILSATVIGLLVLNIYNSLFWGFLILLIFLSLSDLLFQSELFFALSWKSEFRGIHLLADTLVNDEESIIEWSTFLNKHGLKGTSLFAYLDKFKDGKSIDDNHPDIVDKFKQALRYNINESYFLILMQKINSLFILEHSPLTPSKLLEDNSTNLLNSHSQFIVSRLKIFNKSNPIITPLRALLLMPWWSELVKLYDSLANLNHIWERRSDSISNNPIHAGAINSEQISDEVTLLLSSDSTAGQEKLIQLAAAIKKISADKKINFMAFTGNEKFDIRGIPYLFSTKKGKSGLIGVVDQFFSIITQSMRLYPFTRISRLRPNIIILSDTSFLNVELAQFAKSVNRKLKIVYYVPPQCELYTFVGDVRAEKVLKNCDIIFTNTAYQEEYYESKLKELMKKEPDRFEWQHRKIVRISFPQLYDLKSVAVPSSFTFDYGFLPGSRPSEWKWSFKILEGLMNEVPSRKIAVLLPNTEGLRKLTKFISDSITSHVLDRSIISNNLKIYINDPLFLNDAYLLGKPERADMPQFLNRCKEVIAVSGTAATEASFVRPTKVIYHWSKTLYFFAKFIKFKGYQKYPDGIEARDIEAYFRGKNTDENMWWHFSLTNWLIKRASVDNHSDAKELKDIVLKEKLILWRDMNKDGINIIIKEVVSDKNWLLWDNAKMEALRRLFNEKLLVDYPSSPHDQAASIIYNEFISKL